MKYNQFEDLLVWTQSRNFVKEVYIVVQANQALMRDFSLVDQLKRAAYSIMLNIAEGFERGGNKEFANFINIAKGSAGEVRSILYILLDNRFITEKRFTELKNDIINISTNLSNFRKYLLKNIDYKKLTIH